MGLNLHETFVPAATDPLVAACSHKLWMPEGAPAIRCVLVINQRGAGKHLFYQDAEWRAMAARNQAAMMYCEFEANSVRDNGYGLSMLRALDQFSTLLDRPDLATAPLIPWGHSMGGRVVQDFVRFQPGRVLAFHIALRGFPTPDVEMMHEEAEAMQVPGLYLMGAEDLQVQDISDHFERARAKDSPRAWVWLPGQGHWPKGMNFEMDNTTDVDWQAWSANSVVLPWTEAMIRLRLPAEFDSSHREVKLLDLKIASGWLGDTETGQIAAWKNFSGDKIKASWFPTEEVAQAWARFSFP